MPVTGCCSLDGSSKSCTPSTRKRYSSRVKRRQFREGSGATEPFRLSEFTRQQYDALKTDSWNTLLDPGLGEKLTPRDLFVLRLYFGFMGKDYASAKADVFLERCQRTFAAHRHKLRNGYLTLSRQRNAS